MEPFGFLKSCKSIFHPDTPSYQPVPEVRGQRRHFSSLDSVLGGAVSCFIFIST